MNTCLLRNSAFLLTGLPGSGKTFLGQFITRWNSSFVLLSTDTLRKEFHLPVKDTKSEITSFIYHNLVIRALNLINKNYIPLLDATFYKKKFRDDAFKEFTKRKISCFLIWIQTDPQICKNSVLDRRNKGGKENTGVSDMNVFLNLFKGFEIPEPEERKRYTGSALVDPHGVPLITTEKKFPWELYCCIHHLSVSPK